MCASNSRPSFKQQRGPGEVKSRKKLIAGVLIATIALTGVLAGAAAVAADDTDGAAPARSALMARVAELLGIDQSDVEGAFDQALQEQHEQRQEEMEAAREARLQGLIDEGVLTQEQVDELEAWMEARPDNRDEMREWMESRPDFDIDSAMLGRSGWAGASDGMRGMPRGPMGRMPGFAGERPAIVDSD